MLISSWPKEGKWTGARSRTDPKVRQGGTSYKLAPVKEGEPIGQLGALVVKTCLPPKKVACYDDAEEQENNDRENLDPYWLELTSEVLKT